MEAPRYVYINNYNGNDTWGNQWHTKPSSDENTISNKYIRADLAELTAGDIGVINKILIDLHLEKWPTDSVEQARERNEEVLRRFKTYKEKKDE